MKSSEQYSRNDPELDEIIAQYLKAIDEGRRIDRQQFIADHAAYATELAEFFDAVVWLEEGAGIVDAASPQKEKTETPAAEQTLQLEVSRPAETPPAAGEIISYFGDYELLEEIARGGMGVVYKARQCRLNRIVALKMILSGQFASKQDVQRFYVEAEAAARLDHPNIVPIYEVGEHDGRHYYSMGYVEGFSLAACVALGPLPPEDAANLVQQVAMAVQYAHECGVIHRDLKPANVLLKQKGSANNSDASDTSNASGSSEKVAPLPSAIPTASPIKLDQAQPMVTDFGLAKMTTSASDLTSSDFTGSELTGTGQILGTPSYMPPEQAAGKVAAIRETADIYSLGAILYATLTGRPPFQAASPLDTVLQVIENDPVPPRTLNSGVPRNLDVITLKCLSKDPKQRYASARDLADDLNRHLRGEPIHARPMGTFGKLRHWTKRRPLLTGSLLTTLGLCCLAGAVAAVAFSVTLWGSAGFDYFEDRDSPLATHKTIVGRPDESPWVRIEEPGLHELQMSLKITPTMFDLDENFEEQGQYNFRVTWRVESDSGNEIESDTSRIVWNSNFRTYNTSSTEKAKGEIVPVTPIGKFRTADPGSVKIHYEIEKDRQYEAEANGGELFVYENIRDSESKILSGGTLCVASPILLIVGLLLIIYGPFLITTRAKPAVRSGHNSRRGM